MTAQDKLVQRAKDVDAAYASIVFPPLALEDIERGAFMHTTTMTAPAGAYDPIACAFNEGKRAFWLQLEQRIERAKRRHDETQTTAVSATAETSA